MNQGNDVIIIGAGAAGLMAALELAKSGLKILILEATTQVGGRIDTLRKVGFSQSVEAGAEFVHGELPFTMQLLKEAGLSYTATRGDFLQHNNGIIKEQQDFITGSEKLEKPLKELSHDMPVADFLNSHFPGEEDAEMRRTVTQFIEGYEAADIQRASTMAMRGDLIEDDKEQYRIDGGYIQLVNYLEKKCLEYNCSIRLSEPVKEIKWEKGKVKVYTTTATYHAAKTLLTVPIAILQEKTNNDDTIRFSPAIGHKTNAARVLGAGQVIKFLLEFKTPFWKENDATKNMGFIFSEQTIPTWWTQAPKESTLLTGWLGGPKAGDMKTLSDEALLDVALTSLSNIFNTTASALKEQLQTWHVANWQMLPFAGCAYSYATVGAKEAIDELNKPESGTLFFAGEATHTGNATGTVEAALASAVKVVKEILNSRI